MDIGQVAGALERLRDGQSRARLRSNSGSSLITLLGLLATGATALVDVVPAEYSWVAAILTGVAAAVSFYIDRFTVPAITPGQTEEILNEVAAEVQPPELGVYDMPSTLDEAELSATTE